MNILVLSDFFRLGGLENHIITFYEATKAENRYCFCFGEYEDVGILKCDRIYSGFHFSFQATVAELIEDVERLLTIIREEKIDVIHVHPWYAIFPAYFAANIAEVKLVCTYHVTTSANFTCTVFDQIMYEEIISSSVSAIYCVNKYGIDTFSGMGEKNTCFLPNPVDLKQYEVSALPGNRKWALVSRIDSDKYPGVEKAIRMLPDLDIDQVDVYGNGNCFTQLEDLVKETSARVELKGFSPDMGKSLKGNYDGVIGVDRVAIEALTMGIPVLLAGYSKVCGLISQEDYPKEERVNAFGVPDKYLFDYALTLLNERAKSGAPFFATLLTISNHPPFIIPEWFKPQTAQPETQIVEYADYCIGHFLAEAQRQPWYDNTLFIILADHGKLVGQSEAELPQSFNHIPLLIFGPGVNAQRYDGLAMQVDVMPTVLGLLHMSYDYDGFGQDLLRQRRDRVFYTSDTQIVGRDSTACFIYNPQAERYFHYEVTTDGQLRPTTPSPHFDALKDYAFSMVQTAEYLYRRR